MTQGQSGARRGRRCRLFYGALSPVQVARTGAAQPTLGPVMDEGAVAASIAAARDAHQGHDHATDDICTTARLLAEAMAGTIAKR